MTFPSLAPQHKHTATCRNQHRANTHSLIYLTPRPTPNTLADLLFFNHIGLNSGSVVLPHLKTSKTLANTSSPDQCALHGLGLRGGSSGGHCRSLRHTLLKLCTPPVLPCPCSSNCRFHFGSPLAHILLKPVCPPQSGNKHCLYQAKKASADNWTEGKSSQDRIAGHNQHT